MRCGLSEWVTLDTVREYQLVFLCGKRRNLDSRLEPLAELKYLNGTTMSGYQTLLTMLTLVGHEHGPVLLPTPFSLARSSSDTHKL